MCGIFALIASKNIKENIKIKNYALKMARKLRHRGPDGTGYVMCDYCCFIHTRLSIIDIEAGNQPLTNMDETLILSVNGEIFNYKELKSEFNNYKYKTGSDCEVILAIYEKFKLEKLENGGEILEDIEIVKLLSLLDGQFSFVLHDTINGYVLIARDPFGITQLYYGIDKYGNIQVASELKALEGCIKVEPMPSGNYLYFNVSNPKLIMSNYFNQLEIGKWTKTVILPNNTVEYEYNEQPLLNEIEQNELCANIRETLEREVIKRLMCDVKFGCLLSGGLDSSLIASITMKYMKQHPEIYGEKPLLHTFAIGDLDGSDLPYARKVANFIGSVHHEIRFTVKDGLTALEEVIWHLETADITTIRASTPHFLLAQKIQSLGIKMVLSGEGSDEIFGGYLYFHYAPHDKAHQLECKKRVNDLGYFDCLRSDKSTMGNSLETRPPFLSPEFVNLCINIHKDIKTQQGIEKYILRKAFDIKDTLGNNIYLPHEILYRQKEQFSDSITYSWIDTLKSITHDNIMKNHYNAYINKELLFPINTPLSTEGFYYRLIFDTLFPNRANTFKLWIPNTSWFGIKSTDPSGRAISCHLNTNSNY